jgi:Ca-activated chloride channel family protein
VASVTTVTAITAPDGTVRVVPSDVAAKKPVPDTATQSVPPNVSASESGLKLNVKLSEESEPLTRDLLYYQVYEAKKDLGGQRNKVTGTSNQSPQRKLPPGLYYVKVEWGDTTADAEIEVTPGKITEHTFNLNAGYLRLSTLMAPNTEPLTGLSYSVFEAQKNLEGKRKHIASKLMDLKENIPFKLPAGRYYVTAKWGHASADAEVEVKPAEATDQTLILNAGYLRLSSRMAPNTEPLARELLYCVYEPQKDLEGRRKIIITLTAENAFKLPAGRYYVTVEWGKAFADAEVEVKPAQATEQSLILNAGYLKLSTSLAQNPEPLSTDLVTYFVYEAQKDTEGKRKAIVSNKRDNVYKLPAGRYYVTSTYRKALLDKEIEVTAGQVSEIKFEIQTP